jgi:hypothetical protein
MFVVGKILRELGTVGYSKAIETSHGRNSAHLLRLMEQIQRKFVGPDCYWRTPSRQLSPGSTRFFGNGWWLPFPPTLVSFKLVTSLKYAHVFLSGSSL